MIKVLHIIDKLAGSGPTRSLLSAVRLAKELGLKQQHRIVTLHEQVYPFSFIQAKKMGVVVMRKPTHPDLIKEIEDADIVQLHFWNNPEIYEFLRLDKPAMRLSVWYHILGNTAPQIITEKLLDYGDFAQVTSLATLQLPVFKNMAPEYSELILGMVNWDRLQNIQAKAHENFNVGYVGTVNFGKMNPNYVQMSDSIEIPNVKFIVCGGGHTEIQNQVTKLGSSDKFEFRGYVENIRSVLETLDVFGYPLCEDTYATSDISLQEAMYAGVPPIIFPYGGIKHLVKHNQTGLIVNSGLEYKQAIEFLYHNPDERIRLGENARAYALENFNGEKWALKLQEVFERMITQPKRHRHWNSEEGKFVGAEKFMESLGKAAKHFQISFAGKTIAKVLEAENEIAQSSFLLSNAEGGIIQYRNSYPDDAFLRLWSGLVLQHQAKHEKAISEFSAALDLGLNHSSVNWHLSKSAIELKKYPQSTNYKE